MLTHPGCSGFRLMIVFMIATGLGLLAPWSVGADPKGRSNTTRPTVTKATALMTVPLPRDVDSGSVEKNVMPADDAVVPQALAVPAVSMEEEASGDILPLVPELSVHTGAASYRYPIDIPPGRNRMQPDLALHYNHYLRNGPIGVGWVLNVGAIQRSTKFGLDYGSNDRFLYTRNDTTTELVSRVNDWGVGYYGAKVEALFTKYYFDHIHNTWTATTREGTKLYFGRHSASRQMNRYGTFKWHLDRIQDPNDNFLEFTYIEDNGQRLIQRIDYSGWEREGYPALAPTNAVVFYYAPRTDSWVRYTSKSRVATTQQLVRIESYAANQLARKYLLTYDASPTTYRSRLKTIQIVGSDDLSVLPPTIFTYNNSFFGAYGAGASTVIDRSWSGTRFAEIDRDGYTDLVVFKANAAFCLTSKGDGSFNLPTRPCTQILAPQAFADFNGDGYSDILSGGHNDAAVVQLSLGNGAFGGGSKLTLDPDLLKEDGEWLPAELNGDACRDIIYHDGEGRAYLFFSNGDGTFVAPPKTCWPCRTEYLSIRPKLLADVNGDGLTDSIAYTISQYRDGALSVLFSAGDGTFAPGGSTPINADILYYDDFEHRGSFTTAEINGDGLTDVIYRGGGKMFYFLSKGDGTFTSPGPTEKSLVIADSMMDIDNDGFSDVLRRIDGAYNSTIYCSLSANGGQPDALVQVSKGTGAIATIEYRKATAGQGTELPFAMYTVASISVNDGVAYATETAGNDATTHYHYENGLYDYDSRELRGYATVKRTNPDGTVTHFHFLQGTFNKGKLDHTVLKDASGTRTIEQTQYVWREVPTGDASVFVARATMRTTYYDQATVWIEQAYAYDDRNGYAIAVVTSGTDAEGTPSAYNLLTATDYINQGDWLWRPADERLKFQGASRPTRQTKHFYSAHTGNLRRTEVIHFPDGISPEVYATHRYGYDQFGNNIWREDGEQNRIKIRYEKASHTYVAKVIYPVTCSEDQSICTDHIEKWVYDPRYGKAVAQRDQNGFWTHYHYDVWGRPSQTWYPDGGWETITYVDDVAPRYRMIQKLACAATQTTLDTYAFYDGLDRLIQTVTLGENGKAIVRKIQYDAMGRVRLEIGPFFGGGHDWEQTPPLAHHFVETVYDDRSRVERIHSPHSQHPEAGVTTRYAYEGYTTQITDPDGNRSDERRDYLGNITEIIDYTDSGHFSTLFTYNAAGNLLTVTDALHATTTITYDAMGRKITIDDPNRGLWQYRYDKNGNRVWQKDARANEIEWQFDQLNRVMRKTYLTTSDDTVRYAYDLATNGVGKRYAIDNADVSILYTAYDEMGRLTSFSKTISGDPGAHSVQYEYDASGKPIRQDYDHNRFTIEYVYHPGTNLLARVTNANGVEYARCSAYQPNGKIGRIEYPNHTMTVFGYDDLSTQLMSVATAVNAYWKWVHVYYYTPAGDIEAIYDWVNSRHYVYTYDSLHRLVSETNDAGDIPMGYSYDPNGNIVRKTIGNDTYAYHYNGSMPSTVSSIELNGASAFTFAYDDNGNMIQGDDISDPSAMRTRNITYNGDNMPVTIEHSTEGLTRFVYDGEGQRAQRIFGDTTTDYIDGGFERVNGDPIHYIFAGTQRIAQISSGGTFYIHQDHLGSTVMVTNADGAIEPSETVAYRPFGSMRSPGNPTILSYKFTGQEIDRSTGLYNYISRLYDPALGRFTTPDTLVPNWYDSQSRNRFSYCRNNPLIYTDPDGHFPAEFSDWGNGVPDPGPMSDHEKEMLGQVADRAMEGALDGGLTGAIGGSAVGGVPGAIEGFLGGALIGGATSAARGLYEAARTFSKAAQGQKRSTAVDAVREKDAVETPAEEESSADASADGAATDESERATEEDECE